MATAGTPYVGRKVVAMGVPDPHPGRTLYVITRTTKPSQGDIHFHSGDAVELVRSLKARPGKHIYCDGGAQLIHTLLQQDLIDRFIISTVPVMLGSGIRLFSDGRPTRPMSLLRSQHYPSGLLLGEWQLVRPEVDPLQ